MTVWPAKDGLKDCAIPPTTEVWRNGKDENRTAVLQVAKVADPKLVRGEIDPALQVNQPCQAVPIGARTTTIALVAATPVRLDGLVLAAEVVLTCVPDASNCELVGKVAPSNITEVVPVAPARKNIVTESVAEGNRRDPQATPERKKNAEVAVQLLASVTVITLRLFATIDRLVVAAFELIVAPPLTE